VKTVLRDDVRYCRVSTVVGSVVYILRIWINPKHRFSNQLLFISLDFFMHPFWSWTTLLFVVRCS